MSTLLFRTLCICFWICPHFATAQDEASTSCKEGPAIEIDTHTGSVSSGNYRILPLSQYQIIRTLGDDTYQIQFRGSSQLLFARGRCEGNIKVEEGIWKTYDSLGRLEKTRFSIDGVVKWSCRFDTSGQTTQFHSVDFDNDTSFWYDYRQERVFKKSYYPPENKIKPVTVYYPGSVIEVSNAELQFESDLVTGEECYQTVSLLPKTNEAISRIESTNPDFRIFTNGLEPVRLPFTLAAGCAQSLIVGILPRALCYRQSDTIKLFTVRGDSLTLFLSTEAYHITNRRLEAGTPLRLSRSKDGYLIIPPLGTQTDAYIRNDAGEEKSFRIFSMAQIPLSDFLPGCYLLSIYSCNTGGQMEMYIDP
ncbi:MAG: hypothetical protein EOP49_33925 [Sphingobacteriales bacterium]|nr:MAG: hypothetical protein EOP49_33925 [Sphingobacteriales bacterium]